MIKKIWSKEDNKTVKKFYCDSCDNEIEAEGVDEELECEVNSSNFDTDYVACKNCYSILFNACEELNRRFNDTKLFRYGKHKRPALKQEEYFPHGFYILRKGDDLLRQWIDELFNPVFVKKHTYDGIISDALGVRCD